MRVYPAGCARTFQAGRMYVPISVRVGVCGCAVRACTRGCVGTCNAREMRRTTIQILLLLLREQSPVNRPPRHNVSIQVRSAVLNRSGSTLRKSRKKLRDAKEDHYRYARCIIEFFSLSLYFFLSIRSIYTRRDWMSLFSLKTYSGWSKILNVICSYIMEHWKIIFMIFI